MEEQQPSPKRQHEGHFEACPGDTPAAACWRLELHMLLSKIRPEKTYTTAQQHAWTGTALQRLLEQACKAPLERKRQGL